MSAITLPERKPAPPMTPGQVLVEIRRYQTQHHRWPTAAELAVELERHETTIREHAYRLVSQGLIERASGPLVPTDLKAAPEAPVKVEKWTPEQIEEHLQSLGVAPKSPSAKQTQEQDESEEEVATVKDAVAKLPSAEALQAEAEELRRQGEHVTKVLAERYAVDPKDITNALYRARTGHPHGGPRGRPPGPAQPETAPSTMTSEAPERPQEATEAPTQGVGLTEQAPEQAQEPGIIGGVATEGEGQAGGAEEQESSQMARTVRSFSAMRLEDEMEKERQAKMAEVERMRILQQRAVALRTANIIPILIDEIHDDATLGKLVRRLIREGVA